MKNEIKEFLGKLSPKDKDDLYRYVWAEYVREDVEIFLLEHDKEAKEDLVEAVVELVVYSGDYDCNHSYWENIENLVGIVERRYL
jgi:hypothetical protein